MILKLDGPLQIEDLRHHPAETVERLRGLLLAGACASPDPHRKNYYDLEDDDRAFYIHVAPTGTVLLLAAWPREGAHLGTLQSVLGQAIACCG